MPLDLSKCIGIAELKPESMPSVLSSQVGDTLLFREKLILRDAHLSTGNAPDTFRDPARSCAIDRRRHGSFGLSASLVIVTVGGQTLPCLSISPGGAVLLPDPGNPTMALPSEYDPLSVEWSQIVNERCAKTE